jgi:hypothetical protein
MKGIPCDELGKALRAYQKGRKRGALIELAKKAGLSNPVLYRIANQKQETVTYEAWARLHQAAPEEIPPPQVQTMAQVAEGQFPPAALEAYPFLKVVVRHATDALEQGLSEEAFLKLCVNSLENELILRKTNGGGSGKRTA